jgi:pyridoxal phosphate enzyme (YggS family)
VTDGRRAELAANLAALEERVAGACAAAGRRRDEVTVVAVTKTFPVSDVRILADLGVADVAENRDQEASAKAAAGPHGLRWHFVGQLQRNKCRSVVEYAAVVHSVDRPELVDALSAAAERAGRVVDVLLQLNLDAVAGAGRGGAAPAEVPALAKEAAMRPGVRLRGVMAVAPRGVDPSGAFEQLSTVSRLLREEHPGATWISAGMSGDFESAIRHGATHVRVGSVLLGSRSRLKGTVAG